MSLSESHRHIHADGPNGSKQASGLPVLVMAGLPTLDGNSANTTTLELFRHTFIDPVTAYMRKNAYSLDTIHRYTTVLMTLTKRRANLLDPTTLSEIIVTQPWNDGTKQTAVNASNLFFKVHNITVTTPLPTYKRKEQMAFIPLEAELDQLIAGCKHRLATFLQTLKETAARYGEALTLQWTDFNTETTTLAINKPEKGSNPRAVKISLKLATMIAMLPHDKPIIFGYEKETVRRMFQRARKRIAHNLGNPRLMQIHFHTFRHWKATVELHRTNNVYTVMKLLGHKSLSNTQRYIGLLPEQSDDYACEIALDVRQAAKLTENGYDYVTGEYNDGGKLFRKRK